MGVSRRRAHHPVTEQISAAQEGATLLRRDTRCSSNVPGGTSSTDTDRSSGSVSRRLDRRPGRRSCLAQALCRRASERCVLVLGVQVSLRPFVGLLTDLVLIDVVASMERQLAVSGLADIQSLGGSVSFAQLVSHGQQRYQGSSRTGGESIGTGARARPEPINSTRQNDGARDDDARSSAQSEGTRRESQARVEGGSPRGSDSRPCSGVSVPRPVLQRATTLRRVRRGPGRERMAGASS